MLGLLALVTTSIFFGAAVYINIAEYPARLWLPDGAALAEWGPSVQARVRNAGSHSRRFGAAWCSRLVGWAVGAVIMIANWPYTLLAIMPTNHLLEDSTSRGDRDTRERLTRWGHLHAIRSVLGA
jgi:hypothetical protein